MRRSIVLVLAGGLAAGTLMLLAGAADTGQGGSVGRYHLAAVGSDREGPCVFILDTGTSRLWMRAARTGFVPVGLGTTEQPEERKAEEMLKQRETFGYIPSADELLWVKCVECGQAYQMTKRDFFTQIEERAKSSPQPLPAAPNLVCQKCGKEGILRAEKCPKCGHLFLWGSIPADFADRCPQCKFSRTENERKKRLRR